MTEEKTYICGCGYWTLEEEINALDIGENIKKRICEKASKLRNEREQLTDELIYCHSRIDVLEKTIIELSIKRFEVQRGDAE